MRISSLHFDILSFLKGIEPITVVTHRDRLKTEEDCENALFEASAATGSSPSHTFFMTNYTRDNRERNPETERMTFDILHYALLTAERAVKIMKQQQKEDEMMHALEGTSIRGHVLPDAADGNFTAVKIMQFRQNVQTFCKQIQTHVESSTVK